MGDKTSIAWAESTWNPMTGCHGVSAGCDNCYAEKTASWLKGLKSPRYQKGFAPTFHPEALDEPKRSKKPKDIFVCSMSDLFLFGDERIDRVMGVIKDTPQHTYFILTKRHDRMLQYFQNRSDTPTNIIVGVSVENFEWFYQRVAALVELKKDYPKIRTMVSFEPLLENVTNAKGTVRVQSLWKAIDWCIVGGESGQNARPFDPNWINGFIERRDQLGFRLFVKQMGAVWAKAVGANNKKGEDMNEWPEEYRIREPYPETCDD